MLGITHRVVKTPNILVQYLTKAVVEFEMITTNEEFGHLLTECFYSNYENQILFSELAHFK